MLSTLKHLDALASVPADELLARLTGGQRGPYRGDGRGPGRPWAGLVEETPALWVTWFVAAAKRAGQPVPAAILIDGRRVDLVSARLTYGLRWYWQCPRCGRRCEAIYLAPGRAGCRVCLRLGYRSQAQRPASIWGLWDLIFARDGDDLGRYTAHDGVIGSAAADLRRQLENGIRDLLARVAIPPAGDREKEKHDKTQIT